jgi:hypothetical protein
MTRVTPAAGQAGGVPYSRAMVDLTEELRKPPRVNGTIMAIGTVICAFVAVVVGLIFGAWAVLQPYPQPTVGPVSLYVVAAAGFCLAAGHKIGLRNSIMKRGYSDPGWITPGILVVLAAGCMGIWMASLAATTHTPEASATNSVATGIASQPQQAPLTPEQQQVIAGSCGSNYQSCVNVSLGLAQDFKDSYVVEKKFCLSFQNGQDPVSRAAFAKCSPALWAQGGAKSIYQRDIKIECQRADAYAAQILPDQRRKPGSQCDPALFQFSSSSPTSSSGDPVGF